MESKLYHVGRLISSYPAEEPMVCTFVTRDEMIDNIVFFDSKMLCPSCLKVEQGKHPGWTYYHAPEGDDAIPDDEIIKMVNEIVDVVKGIDTGKELLDATGARKIVKKVREVLSRRS
jgi:hypothetical protein